VCGPLDHSTTLSWLLYVQGAGLMLWMTDRVVQDNMLNICTHWINEYFNWFFSISTKSKTIIHQGFVTSKLFMVLLVLIMNSIFSGKFRFLDPFNLENINVVCEKCADFLKLKSKSLSTNFCCYYLVHGFYYCLLLDFVSLLEMFVAYYDKCLAFIFEVLLH